MKVIKFKSKNKFKYIRKVLIKNLILNISVGIHEFEKKKKQRVKFNIEITSNSEVKPDKKNLSTIINYEEIIKEIESITKNKHFELLEDLAENIFEKIYKNNLVKKINLKLEKLDIIHNTESVGMK